MVWIKIVWVFTLLALLMGYPTGTMANPLNKWEISCGMDEGSIRRIKKTWEFRSSSSHCSHGFNERSEISSESISPSQKGTYLFQAKISMLSKSGQPFSIFQIHDGRKGCAPPLKLNVSASGQFEIHSDIKTGEGDSCKQLQLGKNGARSVIRRDGTEQLLEILVTFHGDATFDFTVKVDGKVELTGAYQPPDHEDIYKSEKFYFKHGVYAKNRFEYLLRSTDVSTRRVRQ